MKNKNTMKKTEYVLNMMFWTISSLIVYHCYLFIAIENLSLKASLVILYALVAIFVVGGTMISFKNRRNFLSLFTNIVLPLEIYSVIAYRNYYRLWIKITLGISAFLCVAFVLFVVFQKFPHLLKRRIIHGLLGAKTLAAVCLFTFILPLALGCLFGVQRKQTNTVKYLSWEQLEEWSVANNLDTIGKIEPEIWDTLSFDERKQVLEVIKKNHMRYLGINHEIELRYEDLEKETLGAYSPSENVIRLDAEFVKSGKAIEVMETIAHECHHVYARQQVELYKSLPEKYKFMLIFWEAQNYEKEFENYISAQDNFLGYATQRCELDADIYAKESVQEIYNVLHEHKGETTNEN